VEDEYLGQPFRVDVAEGLWLAAIDGHIVAAMDEASMLDVIEVAQGEQPSLAQNDDFRALRDELSKNFLSFMYVDTEQLVAEMLTQATVDELLEVPTAAGMLKPMAAVVGAESSAFTYQAAAESDEGVDAPWLEPRESRFAGRVPGDTAIFVSTTN